MSCVTEWHSQISDSMFYSLPRLFSPSLSLTLSLSDCDLYTQHVAQWEPCLLNGIALMETYISRIISVFSCKWFGWGRRRRERGGRFNTLPLSMNNSIIWIKWTPGAVGTARRRAVDPLPLPTSLFPSLALSVPPSLRFHSPSTKCHTLVTLVSPRQKLALSWKTKRRGKKVEEKREGGGEKFLSISS